MKAQKLGLVLGMNMAVACMMMQGCKANKAGNEPLPADTTVVAVAPETKQASATVTPGATTSEVETVPGGVVIEPGPTGTGAATTAPATKDAAVMQAAAVGVQNSTQEQSEVTAISPTVSRSIPSRMTAPR